MSNKAPENLQSRRDFEAFISSPPFEKDISRYPDTAEYPWPGCYKDIAVHLAYDTWVEARSKAAPATETIAADSPDQTTMFQGQRWSKEHEIFNQHSIDLAHSKSNELETWRENYKLAQEHIAQQAQQIKSMRARGHRLLVDPSQKEARAILDNIIAQLSIKEEYINLPCINELKSLHKLLTDAPSPETYDESFQARVKPWLTECFGETIAADKQERNHRHLEESLELVQACGCTATDAHQLVDYVYSRSAGESGQEVGGVMVTLAALCLANNLNMHESGEVELNRVWSKIDVIRQKQMRKPSMSPLPEDVGNNFIKHEENKFYQDLGQQVDIECDRILSEKLGLLTEENFDTAQWCQDRMLYDCIPQERAASFLKAKLGMDVKLLPIPEIYLSLEE